MATYKTIQKECILNFLTSHSNEAFTVKEIIDHINSNANIEHLISESTAYRIVNDMFKSGILQRNVNEKRKYLYMVSDNSKETINIICRRCGNKKYVNKQVANNIIDKLEELGYIGDNHNIEILSICDRCK